MYCYIVLPLDLHVLSLSLAFILSQDQTLRCLNCFYLYAQNSYLQGEERLSVLINRLILDGRGDEIQKVVTDKEMREAMYREYQL